ncbi:MAG: hypothetical protein J1E81_07410 [Eubacterium sp.]|nr:hypothetical protein [Eubacterium sp.]
METYRHGSYGQLGDDIVTEVSEISAGVVYLGTAPINLVKGCDRSKVVNRPVTIRNFKEAKEIFGYSSNWEQYTLCEAIKAHFGNTSDNIGPIHLINVLDPSIHIDEEQKTGTITFASKKAYIKNNLMIVDSFELDGKAEGTDYTIEFDYDKEQLIISDISANGIESNTYKYSQIEMPFATMKEAVIGTETEAGQTTGINALKIVYQECGDIPRKVLAPSFSCCKDVNDKIKSVARSINGRFIAQDYADIPLVDDANNSIDTIAKAEAWAIANGYDSEFSKNFWPMAVKGDEKYHISTLFAVRQMLVDAENDGIPYETASNKTIGIDGLYFGASAINSGLDLEDANELNSKGITTAVYYGGNWRLWGGHTAAYKFENETEQGKEIFDTSVAMQIHLANDFILRNAELIDKPMAVGLMQSIVNEEQEILDNLVSIGALTGEPKFIADNMSSNNIKSGSYRWILNDTPTSQFKDGTIIVVFTDKGYSALLGGAENEEE